MMKKFFSFTIALALMGSLSTMAFANGQEKECKGYAFNECVVESVYLPENERPQSTKSTIPVFQEKKEKKCTECGSTTKIVKKAIWEKAPCGHFAYWDGSVCTNKRCEMPFVDRVYLTCNCH